MGVIIVKENLRLKKQRLEELSAEKPDSMCGDFMDAEQGLLLLSLALTRTVCVESFCKFHMKFFFIQDIGPICVFFNRYMWSPLT